MFHVKHAFGPRSPPSLGCRGGRDCRVLHISGSLPHLRTCDTALCTAGSTPDRLPTLHSSRFPRHRSAPPGRWSVRSCGVSHDPIRGGVEAALPRTPTCRYRCHAGPRSIEGSTRPFPAGQCCRCHPAPPAPAPMTTRDCSTTGFSAELVLVRPCDGAPDDHAAPRHRTAPVAVQPRWQCSPGDSASAVAMRPRW